MDLESTLALVPFNSDECSQFSNGDYDCASNVSSQNDRLRGSVTKNLSHEPSCKRLKRSSALLWRSITNFNGYHGRTIANTPSSSNVDSNFFTKAEQQHLNDNFEKAFDSIQLSSGPRITPPIVILTDLTTKCIKSRRLI